MDKFLLLVVITQGCIFTYLVYSGMKDFKRLTMELLLLVQVLAENILETKEEIVTTKQFVKDLRDNGFL